MPAKRGDLDTVDDLGRPAARLCELARDAAHFDHGQRCAVRQHGRHLEHHLELLADRRRRDVAERLDAVAGLEQEGSPFADLAEGRKERPRLAGKDEWRQSAEPLAQGGEGGRCGPLRLLPRR